MLKNIFTNSFGILFSRLLGFMRDVLIASYLGANIYSDIFFIAFKLPNLFRRIFAEGAFVQVFLPAFTKLAIGFAPHTVAVAAPFVAINFYYLILIFSVTFLSSLLQYKNHFATTAFATALLNISLICAVLLSRFGSTYYRDIQDEPINIIAWRL